MKFRLMLLMVLAMLLLCIMAAAVLANEEVPAPYAGIKNPFEWDDSSAQKAGEDIYRKACLGCHGADGSNLAAYNFSDADFAQGLEDRPDFYFWVLSEGRPEKGMPAYISSFSEEQRWQVITYLRSQGMKEVAPEETPPTAKPPNGETEIIESNRLIVIPPEQAQAGRPFLLTAYLRNNEGKPVAGTTVKFYLRVDFFVDDMLEIGEVNTNNDGTAILEYTPRQTGELEVVASSEDTETVITVNVAEHNEVSYRPEAGIHLPASGGEVFIGPKSALEPGEKGTAPTSAFRLPGGILSWLLIVVFAVALIWATYFRVLYQVFGIPIRREIRDADTRLVPLVGMGIVVAMGMLLLLMIATGPYSHFHLAG